jgi:hypothetical protein
MKTTKLMTIVLAVVLVSMMATLGVAKDEAKVYTVTTMAADVNDLGGKEIVITGTIVGACASGCKMWIAEGQYKEGDLFTLVRAKDDAFKFDTKKHGKQVQMTGFVVAKYKDYCGDAAAEGEAEPKDGEVAGSCAAPVKVETATKGDLEEMTFFATNVKYLD